MVAANLVSNVSKFFRNIILSHAVVTMLSLWYHGFDLLTVSEFENVESFSVSCTCLFMYFNSLLESG
jgi:hypothetical protein